MFIRTESFRGFIQYYPVVTFLVAANLVLWIITTIIPGGDFLLRIGIGSNMDVYHGEYWRLITPIFLHGSFGHLLFNCFSLVLFGPALEVMLKKSKFIALYLLSGLAANLGTFFVAPINYLHLGSSSAIFGLFGIYVYMVLYRRDLIDRQSSQIIITILIVGFAMTMFRSNINIFAHIFGLLGGAALGPILLRKIIRI